VAFGAKCLLIDTEEATMPRKELADSVNLVGQRNMECQEVVVACTGFASHKLGFGREEVQTHHSADVLKLLDSIQLTPVHDGNVS
jgi:hypothetical protein